MELILTKEEVRILRSWAYRTISGGHWGDGNVMLGEEKSVLQKLDDSENGAFDFNDLEKRTLVFWMEENKKSTNSDASLSLISKISNF